MPDQSTSDDEGEKNTEQVMIDEDSDGKTKESPDNINDGNDVFGAIEDSFDDDGFELFKGREYISLLETGQISANKRATERYFQDKESAAILFNEETNVLAIIPLDVSLDHPGVPQLHINDGRAGFSATTIFKQWEITPEKTVRYTPEWKPDIEVGIDDIEVDGGVIIDLDEEGEIYSTSTGGSDTSD